MKCYSQPPKPATQVRDATSKRIDEAFERAYRHVYHGEPLRPTADRQAIEDAYQRNLERKRNASKPVEDSAGQLSEAAQSSYRRDLPAEDADPIEAAYQRKMRRLQEGK